MHTKAIVGVIFATVFALVIGGWWWYAEERGALPFVVEEPTATSTPNVEVTRPYGVVTLALGEHALFEDMSIRPISIEEESRCPTGVQCIQAGTVRVKVEVTSAMGTSTNVMTLGKSVTTEAETITFSSATPHPARDVSILPSEYRLTFNVMKRTDSVGGCFVGGCSGQICSDQVGVVSSCEFRSEYACYKSAACERQVSGKCGWTETPAFRACLLNPPSL
ncbi:MAG: hypothetical protein V4449_02530 [Patescibacteria group bacterium]